MKRERRNVLLGLASAMCLFAAGHAAADEPFPSRPVKIVVTLSAGSQVDILARIVADKLSQSLGQPFVVENKAGANGTSAAGQVATSSADGYTLLMTANGQVINPWLYKSLRYDTAKDFTGVSLVAVVPSVLITAPDLPVASVKELIALIKSKPEELNYGSPGIGSAGHMATALFIADAGLKATHVPYKGTPDALTDLMSGRIQFFFAPLGAALPLITKGKVKALAVTTAQRSPALPDLPTISQAGLPGYQYDFWYGLLAPAGTPQPIIDKLASGVQDALSLPEVKEKLAAQGAVPSTIAGRQFDAFLASELKTSGELVRLSGAANTMQ